MFAYCAYFITEISGREVVRVKKMLLGEGLQKRHLKQKNRREGFLLSGLGIALFLNYLKEYKNCNNNADCDVQLY